MTQNQALELPKEHEMPAKDKYTVFSPHAKGYRKGIHKVPKWTRVRVLLVYEEVVLTKLDSVDTENKSKRLLTTIRPIYHIF